MERLTCLLHMRHYENFLVYSLEDTAKNTLLYPFHAKHMCLSSKDFNTSKGQYQPYQTKIFVENVEKCGADVFPLIILIYIDDFAKFRTNQSSTCGIYCTFMNYDGEFLRSLQSIHLLGFAKTALEFWTAVGHIMDEMKLLDGKIIEIVDGVTGELRKYQIIVGGFLWD